MTSVATHAEPIGTRTCAKWLDGREQHLSTTMETWVAGYLASSNQWALALGLAEAPVLIPELLKLIDENCKSTPNSPLANIVFDVIRLELLRGNLDSTCRMSAQSNELTRLYLSKLWCSIRSKEWATPKVSARLDQDG
jgi:hypothetical protein